MENKFEFLEHTADLKIKITGTTLNEIFENAILAIALYMGEGKKISPAKCKVIDVFGEDINSLIYNFIEEILYLVEAERFVACKGSVLLRGNNLHAEIYGDNSDKYVLKHIKAPTYAEMFVKNIKKSKWTAQVVLDV